MHTKQQKFTANIKKHKNTAELCLWDFKKLYALSIPDNSKLHLHFTNL